MGWALLVFHVLHSAGKVSTGQSDGVLLSVEISSSQITLNCVRRDEHPARKGDVWSGMSPVSDVHLVLTRFTWWRQGRGHRLCLVGACQSVFQWSHHSKSSMHQMIVCAQSQRAAKMCEKLDGSRKTASPWQCYLCFPTAQGACEPRRLLYGQDLGSTFSTQWPSIIWRKCMGRGKKSTKCVMMLSGSRWSNQLKQRYHISRPSTCMTSGDVTGGMGMTLIKRELLLWVLWCIRVCLGQMSLSTWLTFYKTGDKKKWWMYKPCLNLW